MSEAIKSLQAGRAMMNRRHYLGLDLIRFCSASLVVLYHFGYQLWLTSVDASATSAIFREAFYPGRIFLAIGWIGVPIFFVLSGYVIAFSAVGRSALEFVKARAARLYPAAWICATITLIVAFGSMPNWPTRYVKSLLLFPVGPWIDGVYWTLAVELAFYAYVACIIFFLGVNKITHFGVVLGVCSSGYWILRASDFATGGKFKSFFDLVEGPGWNLTLLATGCYFSLGICIWWLKNKGLAWPPVLLILLCSSAGVISIVASTRFHLVVDEYGDRVRMLVAPSVWLLAILAIGASIYWTDAIYRVLGSWQATIRMLGLMTYPLYLVHYKVGGIIMSQMVDLGALGALLVTLCAVVTLAYAVTHLEAIVRRRVFESTRASQKIGV